VSNTTYSMSVLDVTNFFDAELISDQGPFITSPIFSLLSKTHHSHTP
jgi:hypothetical protein